MISPNMVEWACQKINLIHQSIMVLNHPIIQCYGAAEDRVLGIPGEDLPNVLSARSFVGWYNGLPQDAQVAFLSLLLLSFHYP